MYRLRRRVRPRPSDESRQAAAHAPGVRRGVPARATGAARRDVGVSVTTRALGDALRARLGPDGATDDPARPRGGRRRRLPAGLGRPTPVAGRGGPRAGAGARRRARRAPARQRQRAGARHAARARGCRARSRPPRRDPRVQPGRSHRHRASRRDGRRAGAPRSPRHRQTLPLDPPGWSRRARSAGSPPPRPAARCGCATAPCAICCSGVRFVQADGVSTWGGAKVVKSVTGYDVPKLMVGSLGTLGVIGELTLRLHPLPETEATGLLLLRGPEAAQEMVARIVDSTLQPNRLEWLDARRAGRAAGCRRPPRRSRSPSAAWPPRSGRQHAAIADGRPPRRARGSRRWDRRSGARTTACSPRRAPRSCEWPR